MLGQDDRGRWLRVALATTHVAIKLVSDRLRRDKIEQVIELAAGACHDLGLPRARVAVCGLNPHAGEGGEMGTEEQTLITPAVRAAQAKNLDVVGPLSADALFYYAFKGEYDAVVAMYHDQGLAPLKMVAFEQGINWTLGSAVHSHFARSRYGLRHRRPRPRQSPRACWPLIQPRQTTGFPR